MKIIYNPKDGAPISAFIYDGKKLQPHFPDGYLYNSPTGPVKSNGLMQYTDETADEILERFGFLQELTLKQAEEIVNRPALPDIKCEYPGCDFVTTHKVALAGHGKSHKKETDTKPAFDPTIIPVAGGESVTPIAHSTEMGDNSLGADIPNGPDKDGVDWYGEGAVVQNNSEVFGAVKPNGKGHFVG